MPFYQIYHSFPLTRYQKSVLAQHITQLHSTEFLTPSLFVNVAFFPTEPVGDFFLAGKPVSLASPNRIMGLVRTGPKRTKERFDAFGQRLQEKWYEVVNGPTTEEDGAAASNGVSGGGGHQQQSLEERKAKKLHFVAFTPIIAAIENGVTIPSADNEASWLVDNMAYFKEQAEVYGDEDFRDMIREVHERPDLKKLIA